MPWRGNLSSGRPSAGAQAIIDSAAKQFDDYKSSDAYQNQNSGYNSPQRQEYGMYDPMGTVRPTTPTPGVTKDSNGIVVVRNPDGSIREYTVDDHSKEHVNASSGNGMNPHTLEAMIKNNAVSVYPNKVTAINRATGEVTVYDGYVYNGVTYERGTGKRIVEGGESHQVGLIPGKDDILRDTNNQSTTVWYNLPPAPKPTPTNPAPPYVPPGYTGWIPPEYRPEPYIPPAPTPPSYEVFNLPAPTFSADLQRAHRFIYFLGMDKLEVKSRLQEKTSIRIMRDIEVGKCEWIELEVDDYIPELASIEYYIIDGDEEIPILPNNRKVIVNEKIFPTIPTLFPMNDAAPVIRKEGIIIDAKYDDIKNERDGIYSITYQVEEGNKYQPKEESVKVKTVLRLYDDESDIPFIADIKIKIYGSEGVLWQDSI